MTREKKNRKNIINSLVKIWLRWFKKKCLNDQKRRFSEYSVVNHLKTNDIERHENFFMLNSQRFAACNLENVSMVCFKWRTFHKGFEGSIVAYLIGLDPYEKCDQLCLILSHFFFWSLQIGCWFCGVSLVLSCCVQRTTLVKINNSSLGHWRILKLPDGVQERSMSSCIFILIYFSITKSHFLPFY